MPQVVRPQLDYYAVLEIAPSADPAEVNSAFRRLAWRYHPDRNPASGATLQFQDINEAHQVLSDPGRRAEYDARWHPRSEGRSHTPASTLRPRYRRHWRRHRQLRHAVLSVFALLFITSAWAVIFSAMTAAHSAGASFVYEGTIPSRASGSSTCSFSMEMFPVSYLDERGMTQTDWEADVYNCYGISARISALPRPQRPRPSRFASELDAR